MYTDMCKYHALSYICNSVLSRLLYSVSTGALTIRPRRTPQVRFLGSELLDIYLY